MTGSAPHRPRARVARLRPSVWVWLIPLLALGLALGLLGRHAAPLGPVITLAFPHGHGLKAGDSLRYRGILAGEVLSLTLAPDGEQVVAKVRLQRDTQALARAGSQFWIVRPTASLQGLDGLDTLAGPRYLAMIPGSGPPQRHFEGLADAPVRENLTAEGLEIMLESPRRLNLQAGAPLTYRGIRIGSILSVGLASDAASVEARAFVRPAYVGLIRENSQFWHVGGVTVSGHVVSGIQVQMPSLQGLLTGGVALATPNQPGNRVMTGHRFSLAEEPDAKWLAWRAPLPVGTDLLPTDTILPSVQRVTVRRAGGRLMSTLGREHAAACWAVPLPEGLLLPASVLPQGAENVRLERDGQSLPLDEAAVPPGPEVRAIPWSLGMTPPPAFSPVRPLDAPEDVVVLTDRPEAMLAIAPVRLRPVGSGWEVDPAVLITADLHGAAVLGRTDGHLLGVLLISEGKARIASVPR